MIYCQRNRLVGKKSILIEINLCPSILRWTLETKQGGTGCIPLGGRWPPLVDAWNLAHQSKETNIRVWCVRVWALKWWSPTNLLSSGFLLRYISNIKKELISIVTIVLFSLVFLPTKCSCGIWPNRTNHPQHSIWSSLHESYEPI